MNGIELPSEVQSSVDLMREEAVLQLFLGRGQIELKKRGWTRHLRHAWADVEPQDPFDVGIGAEALDELLRQISAATGNGNSQFQERGSLHALQECLRKRATIKRCTRE